MYLPKCRYNFPERILEEPLKESMNELLEESSEKHMKGSHEQSWVEYREEFQEKII